ncbi:MAG: methyltransferase type 11 [Gammaproteobacteria bacterium RIFCSPLOWO2_02_FULL_42_14]|nr:MAG: methyltransferase type 11 [Gammaproteobacteria bacterium RIFCSPHIGHO2_02_FULL_42_43]OGT28576.1 MAG: methyltransferase type 11 [Gammaproteobacteria bacterium RIFCSPHIGHO2_01_FULL_42_8]OGT51599.1 MAG: methyltransferase type 11 [Gammaproteobacteria bacterium RIFCSPHIGHO2_12_FULL_41_25]OGT62298.1 MAG: methyltransferase type 11 [Gammaproteobacteria bacterium RIFCSPLOWO2_02_FULL_42_14]OGT85973.1 MAG: methyltransferase type 11 [Gammaproteobacteria bacterium RIFCSPLOWO2_12_FULL_42_18]
MKNYPRSKRDVAERGLQKTETDRAVARQFGKAFFDGSRDQGYGGFHYHPKYWELVIHDFQKQYQLNLSSSVLDIGCAKGFMLHDMARLIPGISVAGIDISEYAISNAIDSVKAHCHVACATKLPFPDKSFDCVISITTLHNFERKELIQALKEIERVKRKYSFITVDAYHDDEEKKRMEDWNLTAKTVLHVDDWKKLFLEAGYTGDYYWFTP